MSFITVKRTLGFKLEGTPYTAETLVVTDYNVPAFNISYDPDIQTYARRIARGDYTKDPSIAGKRSITITFSHDVTWSGAAGTAPSWFKCLQACGGKEQSFGTFRTVMPHADYSNVPATIEVVEKDDTGAQLVIKGHGCMGNPKMVVDSVGQPMRIDYEFKGVFNGVVDRAAASILVPTGFDTPLPEGVLTATMTAFADNLTFDKVTIDWGNQIELYTDPSKGQGLSGARVVDRNPSVEIDPDMVLLATSNHYQRQISNTTGAVAFNVGNHFLISAPAGQLIQGMKPGDREGHVTNTLKFELKRSVGNDSITIKHW